MTTMVAHRLLAKLAASLATRADGAVARGRHRGPKPARASDIVLTAAGTHAGERR